MLASTQPTHRRQAVTAHGDRVGPNAILQLIPVLEQHVGTATTRALFRSAKKAHWISQPPQTMIPERDVQSVFVTVIAGLGLERAYKVFEEAGYRTGDYICRNRIPSAARWLLSRLPAWIGMRLLLLAVRKHAWTFAGTGSVSISLGRSVTMDIRDNPLKTPEAIWHQAVLTGLFRAMTSPHLKVAYSNQQPTGSDRFTFHLNAA